MLDMITTERLVLRPYKDADADVLLLGFNDVDVVKWLSQPPYPFTRDDVRLRNVDGSSRWPDVCAIELDGQMVGSMSCTPHFGFWLLQRVWGLGLATEAGRAMIRTFFKNTDQMSLDSGYFVGHAASANVLQKLGFKETHRGMRHCRPQNKSLPFVAPECTRPAWELAHSLGPIPIPRLL